ncbi:Nn.00g053500.m01.CDS01 [Neocucurbitaria sp. VM-36]
MDSPPDCVQHQQLAAQSKFCKTETKANKSIDQLRTRQRGSLTEMEQKEGSARGFRPRSLPLPFRKKKETLVTVAPAPLLPELSFNANEKNVMNGSVWTSDDPLHTANAIPPRSTNGSVMPALTSSRNVSGPLSVETAVMAADPNTVSPWARPNPHSTPNSKTSQYIDKITSENDRLRRELKSEKLAREDEAKRVSAARSKAEDSRAEFQHLQVLADTNARAIERKDRKLEELKATLEAEAKRRRAAEQRAEEALKMLGDTRSETQRQLSQAYEMKGLAETQLETARDGFKRITDGYEKKMKHITEALNELRKQRIEDADKIKRQAIISDQLHHEMSRTTRTEDKMADMMSAYKKEHRKEMDALVQEAQRLRLALPEREREAQRLVDAMNDTRDKMRWVMTQQRHQAGS